MASDGPSKPLVPPPPTLSSTPRPAAQEKPAALPEDDAWLELIEDEPTSPKDAATDEPEGDAPPDAPIEDEPTSPKQVEAVAASPSESNAAAENTEDERESTSKTPTGPNRSVRSDPPPIPRRGLLPPPKSDGKRVQPVQAKPRSERAARPSAAGLPSGMRPPGAPEVAEREDTDVLIASAVAALTEGEEPPAEDAEASADAVGATAEAPTPDPVALAAPVAASEEPRDSRRLGLWIGLGAVAAVLVAFVALGSGDDEPPDTSASAAVVAEADAAEPPVAPPQTAPAEEEPPVPAEAALPDLGAPTLPPDVGTDDEALALADALDVGGGDPKLDLGSSVEVAMAEEPPTDDDGRRGKTKRRRKPKAAAAEPSRPAPAAPATKKPDADALLADARKALTAGQARKAYSLASKSRSAKRTSAALVVMAKAACRFGGEAQAKSAFNQLSVSARRGIRSECRSHGVRLGL